MTDYVQTQVRLPAELHATLAARAADRGVSVNKIIIRALTYAMAATEPTYIETTTRTVQV